MVRAALPSRPKASNSSTPRPNMSIIQTLSFTRRHARGACASTKPHAPCIRGHGATT